MLLAVDRVSMLRPANPDPNRVLLVRVDNIGDFVLWLDAARALTDHYRRSGAQVTLLGSSTWATWADELGIFDAVLPLEQERFKRDVIYRLHMGRRIRMLGFGVAVHAASTRVMEMGDSLVRISGARETIGPRSSATASAADTWYTRLVDGSNASAGELRRNAAFVTALTGSTFHARVADLRASARQLERGDLSRIVPELPYFVLFPGASSTGRKWPASRFIELARRIHGQTGWAGLVGGGAGEISDAETIARESGWWLQSAAGQTTLAQLTALLAGAKLLISNDTSAIHIGAALGVSSVCVLGGGHFGRFLPYEVDVEDDRPLPRVAAHQMGCFGCEWICKFHPPKEQPMPCIEKVTVEDVWQEVLLALDEKNHHSLQLTTQVSGRNPTKGERTAAHLAI